MSNKHRIEEGDTIHVHFERNESLINMIVLGIPNDTGDCWKLIDEKGIPWNVQQYCNMELIKKGK